MDGLLAALAPLARTDGGKRRAKRDARWQGDWSELHVGSGLEFDTAIILGIQLGGHIGLSFSLRLFGVGKQSP